MVLMEESQVIEDVETGGALDSVDDIAALFDTMDDGETEGTDTKEAEGGESQSEELPEEAVEGEMQTSDDREAPQEELVEVPSGWDGTVFKTLTPEARNAVVAREQAHAEELKTHAETARQAQERKAQFEQAVSGELAKAAMMAKQVFEAEFGSVNWLELQKNDPQQFLTLDAERKSRLAAVQGLMQRASAVRQYAAQQEAQAQAQRAHEELMRVAPEIRSMMGGEGFNGKDFVRDLSSYLTRLGVPAEVQTRISTGYEIKIATKAMLYDRLLEQQAAAKAKVAEAPKVEAPKPAHKGDAGNERLSQARAMLRKNPDSMDALVAVYDNM